MKKILALLLCALLALPVYAESAFDFNSLKLLENAYVYEESGTVNTVVRMLNQPYIGQLEDGELYLFVDYIKMPDYEMTLLRLYVSLTYNGPVQAEELALTVGGKTYTFTVDCQQSEYDGVFMEDYRVCLTGTSLPLLKAVAQQKKDAPIPVAFLSGGETLLTGEVILPGDDAAYLYDMYIDLGGKRQNLDSLNEVWPCDVKKN